MRNAKGQFLRGFRSSPTTEFKPGEHWRKPQVFREKAWLEREYVQKNRSAGEIAAEFGITSEAVCYWLKRHGIPRRTTREARSVKRWAVSGPQNGMYGRRGPKCPSWRGGHTKWRQHMYAHAEYGEFQRQVWARDRVCRMCGAPGLEIHHIDPVAKAPLLILDVGNAILLCAVCHNRLRGKERWWRRRLYRLISESKEVVPLITEKEAG